MVTIGTAYCDEYKRVMSFDEITEDVNFEIIKHTLRCATEGCPSRVSYVRGDKACLRTYRGDNHSEDCKDAFERIKKAQRAEKVASAFVLLTEDDFNKKHKYLLKKYLKKEDKSKTPRSSRRKKLNETIDSKSDAVSYTEAKLGTGESGGETLEELREGGTIVRGPSFPAKELNHISEDDIGSKCGIVAEVTSVRRIKDKVYEIDVKQNGREATLILPEAFFSNRYIESENYINALGHFINNINHYELYILTYCEVSKIDKNSLRLAVLDYTWLSVAVSKPPLKVLRLPQFVALYSRGNFSK